MTTVQTPTDTMPRQNLYKVLNVAPTAPADEVKQAISRELRLWSNRTNAPQIERRQEAERMVKLLEQAETILLEPSRRSKYDAYLRTAPTVEREVDEADLDGEGDLLAQGWRLLAEGSIPEALYVATKATDADAKNPEAWALLAQAKHRWGDTEDAIYEYKRAIRLLPNKSSYYFDLGSVYESAERFGDALEQYRKASQIEPATTMYQAAIGVLLLKQEEYDSAIEILERCIATEPDNKTYQWFLAIAYADSAYQTWTFVGEERILRSGYYATERYQVEDARRRIARAREMTFDDPDLAAHLQKVSNDADGMLKRRFYGSILAPVLGGLVWSLVFGIGIVFLILYFIAARPPQFAINRRLLSGDFPVGDTSGGEPVEKLFGSAIIGAFLPFMVVYNFIKNYTGKNKV